MRARETLRILGGSILVYVAVATCQVAGSGTSTRDGGSVDVSAPGGLDVSRVLDVLTNPVPAAQADSTQSGSRLKAIYFVGADGSKQPVFNQWYDSQRREHCMFTSHADGNYYCLPVGTEASGMFSDAGCTQPLVAVVSGCAAPTTARTYATTSSCAMSVSVLPIVSQVAPEWSYQLTGNAGTSAVVSRISQVGPLFTGAPYSGTPSSCNKATAPSGYYALHSLGAEIPASSFVSATVQTDQ